MKRCVNFSIAAILFVLAACGGGGGGSTPPPEPTPTPTPPPPAPEPPSPEPPPSGDQLVSTTFDAQYWSLLSAELSDFLSEFRATEFLYADVPNLENCDPGTLSDAAQARYLETYNAARRLHGLTEVTTAISLNTNAQQASLVQAGRKDLAHQISEDDPCWVAEAEVGFSDGNLVGPSKVESTANLDPAYPTIFWVNDTSPLGDTAGAGRRTTALRPSVVRSVYGQAFAWGAQLNERDDMMELDPELEFVAAPYRRYPYLLADTSPELPLKWSFSLVNRGPGQPNPTAFDVSVVNAATGEPLTVTDVDALGDEGTWVVPEFEYDTEYTVTISNISNAGNGREIAEYPVEIVYGEIFDIGAPAESQDVFTDLMISGRFDSRIDRDGFAIVIDGDLDLTVSPSSGSEKSGFYIQIYDNRKRLIEESDQSTFRFEGEINDATIVITPCPSSAISIDDCETVDEFSEYVLSIN